MPRRLLLLAAITLTPLLAFVGWKVLRQPSLQLEATQHTLLADGREHRIATLTQLPLHSTGLHITGAPTSNLRLEDIPHGKVALYLRAAVTTSQLRLTITANGTTQTLPITLTPDPTDSFSDGTPDWLRLHAASDRQAFRNWFTALTEQAADTSPADLPPELVDCASLLRYAYRESLRLHDDRWYAQFQPGQMPTLPSIQQWTYPNTPLAESLFRTRPGPYLPSDLADSTFTQFADAKTLLTHNAYLLSRNLHSARPGDLIFYRLFEDNSQYHSMVITGEHSEWVIYHTGPINHHQGEMRRVLLADLINHPDPRWRPTPTNPNFLGVYRWNILREDYED